MVKDLATIVKQVIEDGTCDKVEEHIQSHKNAYFP